VPTTVSSIFCERKGRGAMEQDFHGDFQVNVTWFFASFSSVLDLIVLILVWFERSLHSAQVRGQSCPWPLKLMTSQRVEGTWILTGGYGWFTGEWVKRNKVGSHEFSWNHKIVTDGFPWSLARNRKIVIRGIWNPRACWALIQGSLKSQYLCFEMEAMHASKCQRRHIAIH